MARGPDAFFYGFTGIINHRFLTNQITRTISVILRFMNACRLLSALPSLSQFGRGRLSLVAISFYALRYFSLVGIYPGRASENAKGDRPHIYAGVKPFVNLFFWL